MSELKKFDEMPLLPELIAKLEEKSILQPTAVQQKVIPEIAAGKNIIFQSETGTGKTFAYLLPLLTMMIEQRKKELAEKNQISPQPRVLICAPTHELASQVRGEAEFLCGMHYENPALACKSALFIGGTALNRQLERLKEKPQILVGGPARLLELIHLKKLKTEKITALVLDEVDRLFSPELRDITTDLLKALPDTIQLIACSATVKKQISTVVESCIGKNSSGGQEIQTILLPAEDVLRQKITHIALHAEKRDKIDCLRRLILAEKPEKALVFSAEIGQIANIVSKLQFNNIQCSGLHAKTDKIERKQAIDTFRSGKCSILITSDLAARGLDIVGITHIIQMDVPQNEDFFVHRAGRTARAGKEGKNIVIGDEWELRNLANLEKKLGIIIYPKILYGGSLIAP